MTFVVALLVCAVAIAEIVVPGHDYPYHAGWFNLAIIAAWSLAAWEARRTLTDEAAPLNVRAAVGAIVLGSGIACVAVVASGLLGPDARAQIGAPGQRVQLTDTGDWLAFPLPSSSTQPSVVLQRGASSIPIDRPRHVGAFVYSPVERSVVSVVARDRAGNRLTITQPEGASFLSPVLLMTQTQKISGTDMPFDGFAVPAARRNVKAVLFSARTAAALHAVAPGSGPAVLFAVDDDGGQPLPHGIALSAAGRAVRAGGIILSATVLQYPSIEIVSAPLAIPVWLGTLLSLAGIASATVWRRRWRRSPAPQA